MNKPLRFMLFGGDNYYPSGGVEDLHGTYDSLSTAMMHASTSFSDDYTWWNIIDFETGKKWCKYDDES